HERFLWLRTRLVGPEVHDPTLYIEIIDQLCEAFLDGQLIYRFGHLDGQGRDARRFNGYPVHFIPLGEHYQGRTLTLRIYSEHINIGLSGRLRIGNKARLIVDAQRQDFVKAAIGVVLAAIGLLAFALSISAQRDRAYLYYAGFALGVGIWILCRMRT